VDPPCCCWLSLDPLPFVDPLYCLGMLVWVRYTFAISCYIIGDASRKLTLLRFILFYFIVLYFQLSDLLGAHSSRLGF
jgi:hypothetical protein